VPKQKPKTREVKTMTTATKTRKETYAEKLEKRVKADVEKSLAEHTISLIQESGMHRHWRCQKPGTCNMGFDIVTWPGSLCYTGDMGHYLFQRTEDMVSFMSGSAMSFEYAAEKCVAHDGQLEEFREERFNEILEERLQESRDDDEEFVTIHYAYGNRKERVSDKIDEIRLEYANYNIPSHAEKAMYESGLWDGCDLPSCKEYTYNFLWALHAIKWFCDKA
jgi:hypothetical protein